MHGIAILDKTAGISSARALNVLKGEFGRGTKVGHAGTLDPFATGILIALFYFIDPDNIPLIMIHQGVTFFIAAPLMPLFWSMIADTADYGAWKLGQRSTGLLFSAGTFSQKIGWSIGPALSMALLGWFGFTANQTQSSETVQGLRLLMSLIPAVFALLAAGAVFFYKIDAKTEKKLEAAMLKEEEALG